MKRVLDFAKSRQAPEKLRGQWCYQFISAKGCQDEGCGRTHVAELAGVDLCIGWCTRGSCTSGDKCKKSGWHREDMKCVLTRARDGNGDKLRGDKVLHSNVESTVSSSCETKARFAAEIKPKSSFGDVTQASCRTNLLNYNSNGGIIYTTRRDNHS